MEYTKIVFVFKIFNAIKANSPKCNYIWTVANWPILCVAINYKAITIWKYFDWTWLGWEQFGYLRKLYDADEWVMFYWDRLHETRVKSIRSCYEYTRVCWVILYILHLRFDKCKQSWSLSFRKIKRFSIYNNDISQHQNVTKARHSDIQQVQGN